MNTSGKVRALGSLVSVFVTAVVLLAALPARAAVTIDASCAAGWTWNAQTQTLSCGVVTPPPPGAPSGCTLTPNPTSRTEAGNVNLSVSCSGGGAATSYAWSATGVTFNSGASTNGGTNSATISANTTFTVVASNDSGAANPASAFVTVGGVVGGLSCPGFTKTVLVNWDWGTALTKIDTWQTQSGIGTNGILVVPFIATAPANNVLGQISATGYPAPNMENQLRLAISTQPCDLNPPAPAASTSISPTVKYVVGVSPLSGITGKPTAAALTPGVQYYLNIAGRRDVTANAPSGTQTCVPGINYPNCELRLSVQKPAGH